VIKPVRSPDYMQGYKAGYSAALRAKSSQPKHGHEHHWVTANDQRNAGKMSVIKTCTTCHIEQGFLKEEYQV
jgi:hypothetical protein